MRNIIFYLSFLFLLMGCSEDFLNRKPLGKETTDSFFSDAEHADENFEKMMVACYECFNFDEGQWGGVGHHGEWMWDLVTDDAQKGGDGAGDYASMLEWRKWSTLPTNMGPASSAYITFNVAKERANTILFNLENYKQNLSPENYKRLKGEALFIRGYSYFYAAKLFGKVPYFTSPILPDQFKNPKSLEPEELYSKIEADLIEAVSLLEEKSKWMDMFNVQPEGRATKGAARAMLARVITMEIGFGFNGKTWQDVYDVTSAIIASGEYALVPNFATIFEQEGENSSESVFEVQTANLGQGWGKPGGNIECIMVTPRLTCGNNKNKLLSDGWGFLLPTESLSKEFEYGDPRRKCTIIENGGILWEDGDAATDQKIDITVKDKCPTLMFSRKYSTNTGEHASTSSQNPEVNKRICRYAEVLLTHAEAAAHIVKDGEAKEYVNKIRARARISTLPKGSQLLNSGYPNNPDASNILPDVTATGDALILAIQHERRVELAHEGHRMWDLIRWGLYKDAIKTYTAEDCLLNTNDPDGSKAVANFESHLIGGKVPCFPIPDSDVQMFGVEQNRGY